MRDLFTPPVEKTCGTCVVFNGRPGPDTGFCSLKGHQRGNWPACEVWFGKDQLHAALYGRKLFA